MILFYTGTGNSKYVAQAIAAVTGDELVDLRPRIKAGDHTPVQVTGGRLVIAAPTYGYRLPRVVEAWLQETPLVFAAESGEAPAPASIPVYVVMTCGDDNGHADKHNRRLLRDLAAANPALAYAGTAEIIMPENYLAMFPVPDAEESARIVEAAAPSITEVANRIAAGDSLPAKKPVLLDRIKSDIVNPWFYRFQVKSDAFVVSDACVGCGKCVTGCPVNGIALQDGRPAWTGACTHCMACICYCPAEAIEYGKASLGRPRYKLDC